MHYKDLFSGHAKDYAAYRPHYPRELFEYLVSLCPTRKLAWDCGTGNGQAAVALADYFEKVVATDASDSQLKAAQPHSRVQYLQAPAEKTPLASRSADLVTVAQALHWFKHSEFFIEAERVLKPGGPLAVWCYELCEISPEVDRVVLDFYRDTLGDRYWEPERKHVEAGYRDISVPFEELKAPAFRITARWSLEQLVGYLSTWSAVRKYVHVNSTNPVKALFDPLKKAWGEEPVREAIWPVSMRVFRVVHR